MPKILITVKLELIKQNITQKELATKIGISPEYLSKIISGKHTCNVNIAIKIAKNLNSNVEYLFGKEQNKKDKLSPTKENFSDNFR